MDHTRLRDAGIKATYPRLKILDIFHQHAGEHARRGGPLPQPDRRPQQHRPGHGVPGDHATRGSRAAQAHAARRAHHRVRNKRQGHHDHMVCTHCGRILESSDPSMSRLVGTSPGAAASRWSPTAWCSTAVADAARAPPPTFTENSNEPRSVFFHDLSHFPIVTAKHGGAPDGYSASWIREMEMLVNNPQPFVLVVPDMRQEAGHEDRKAMVEWQTTNMPRLRARCRAFIAVERDAEALEKIRKRAEKMARAFDMPFWRSPVPPKPCSAPAKCWARPAGGFNLS